MEQGLRRISALLPSPPPPPPRATQSARQFSILKLLDREWMLPDPGTRIDKITAKHRSSSSFSFSVDPKPALGRWKEDVAVDGAPSSFYAVRDDLLHPFVNGNKARKLDALLPLLRRHGTTDVVTCGGCQSAHAAAVAVSCAERGIKSHLLLRGEPPEIPTGYNLVSLMYGNTTYIPRSAYADREGMLYEHANLVAGSNGSVTSVDDVFDKSFDGWQSDKLDSITSSSCADPWSNMKNEYRKVVIVNEGAGNAAGLLGVIRLLAYLSQRRVFGPEQPVMLVLDAGTGTTAVGLALGISLLGLPWKVTAVMLADTIERYKMKEKVLITNFKRVCKAEVPEQILSEVDGDIVNWVDRIYPRRFGKVLTGEIEFCQQIARDTGILLDPIYTLAGWEQAHLLSQSEAERDAKVVMLHTGGTLGMFGLAQRYTTCFRVVENASIDLKVT